MVTWLVILAGGVLTYAMRLSFIVLFGKVELPGWLQRALRYILPAVLTAIIFPEMLMRQGNIAISTDNTRLLAGLAAVLVAQWKRSTLLTILAGMVVLVVLEAL